MARRLLITGATGGLGLALVDQARGAGHDVVATGRSAAARVRIEAQGATFVSADLDDADLGSLCRGRDTVIHAAALSASWGDPEAFARINVAATRGLLAAARKAGCTRFVFVSSPSIFAGFADRIGIRSTDPPASPPLNDYARTKLAGEQMVLAANGSGFATCAVRPRAIVGPDDRVLLPRLVELVRRPRAPLPNRGGALVELTDVRDAARAILLAEDRIAQIAGRGVNVSGGSAHRVDEIARALAAELGHSPRFVNLPVGVGRAIAAVLEWRARAVAGKHEPLLTRYTLATLAYSQTFDHDETARLIGYRPRHDALATLLAEAGRRYR